MGQYYKAVTFDKEGNKTVYSLQSDMFRKERNFDFYNGIKLMEHSWIGNSFTDFFSKLIYKNPLAVVWVGDYASDAKTAAYERNCDFPVPEEKYETFCNSMWSEDTENVDFIYKRRHFGYRGKYLVNHTKKCYFSLNRFAHKKQKWIVYPISLLCAIGNGLGGGDYWGADEWLVGTWALDIISIEDEIPEGYSEDEIPDFYEEW